MTMRMLLALQPEPGSTSRIEAAGAWAERFGATLDLITVIHPPHTTSALDLSHAQEDAVGVITTHRNATDWLEGLMPAIPFNVRGKAHVLTGSPAEALLNEANPGDLIVMGTHHRTDVMRLFLGSVAEKIVREAPCSILVLSDGSPLPPTTGPISVRAPVDITHPNGVALNWLAKHADTHTTAVYVLPWVSVFGPIPTDGNELYQETTDALKKALASIGHGETDSLVLVREEMGTGDALAHEANDAGAHLIAMPTHGRTGLLRAVLGSVAERTVRAANCAVLVVR